jgi:hypothetical protein
MNEEVDQMLNCGLGMANIISSPMIERLNVIVTKIIVRKGYEIAVGKIK